jgi:hypothetical protein
LALPTCTSSLTVVVSLFGHPYDSPQFKPVLDAMGATWPREPKYPDRYQHFDYIDFDAEGIRFVFGDEVYYRSDGGVLQGKPPVLTSVFYYSGDPYYHHARFAGTLPHGLTWSDSRQDVRKKLGPPQWQFPNGKQTAQIERWDIAATSAAYGADPYWLLVFYTQDNSAIQLMQLGWAPRVETVDQADESDRVIQCYAILPLLHQPWSASAVRAAFQDFDLQAALDACGGGCAEVDAIVDHGVELYFDPPSDRDRQDTAADVYRFSGIRMVRTGDMGSRFGFRGTLPYGLEFADRPEQVITKVGMTPTAGDADEFSGYYAWKLPDYLLHVMFSVQEQRSDRVTVIAHGYYDTDLLL